MTRRSGGTAAAVLLAALIGGCAEKPQELSSTPGANYSGKPDTAPWNAEPTAHSAGGYAKGDRAGWEKALKVRADGQNEYVRIR